MLLGVIPARKGSSFRDKNIRPLLGKPLIVWTIEDALEAELLDVFAVSSDSPVYLGVARKYGALAIERPEELATDDAPIELAVKHAVEFVEGQAGREVNPVVLLQADVPFREEGIIDRCISIFNEGGFDSVVTVREVSEFPEWMYCLEGNTLVYGGNKEKIKYRRQDMPKRYVLDGGVEVISRRALFSNRKGLHCYLGERMAGVVHDKKYGIDVDSELDLRICEVIGRELLGL